MATTGSNVRKDLTEWQEKHATMVLTTVKVNSLLQNWVLIKYVNIFVHVLFHGFPMLI